jgi:phosphate transport system substrate-binding protein
MNRIVSAVSICIIIVIAMVLSLCQKSEVKPIRIFGSTTVEPFMKKALTEYAKSNNISFSVNAMGSKSGIDSLIAGACDIAMSSSEILPEQTERALKNGVRIKPFLLGYDAIVPIVNPSNSVSDITFQQLKGIFEGKISRWSALGGLDTLIDVVDRSGESGTYAIWHHFIVPETDIPSPTTYEHLMIEPSNSSVMAYIFEHTNAIGYVSNVYLNPEVKPLKLNGISVIENDSLLGQYHLKRPLYLFVNEDRFDQDLKEFIIFLIISDTGRTLLHETGFFSTFSLAPLYNAVDKMSKR